MNKNQKSYQDKILAKTDSQSFVYKLFAFIVILPSLLLLMSLILFVNMDGYGVGVWTAACVFFFYINYCMIVDNNSPLYAHSYSLSHGIVQVFYTWGVVATLIVFPVGYNHWKWDFIPNIYALFGFIGAACIFLMLLMIIEDYCEERRNVRISE